MRGCGTLSKHDGKFLLFHHFNIIILPNDHTRYPVFQNDTLYKKTFRTKFHCCLLLSNQHTFAKGQQDGNVQYIDPMYVDYYEMDPPNPQDLGMYGNAQMNPQDTNGFMNPALAYSQVPDQDPNLIGNPQMYPIVLPNQPQVYSQDNLMYPVSNGMNTQVSQQASNVSHIAQLFHNTKLL